MYNITYIAQHMCLYVRKSNIFQREKSLICNNYISYIFNY